MLKELEAIYNPSIRQQTHQNEGEIWDGSLKKSIAEELHKPIKRKFKKRRVLVNGIDRIWAADLVDMQAFSKFIAV